MSNLSHPMILKDTGFSTPVVTYRVYFDVNGSPVSGLSVSLTITSPTGTNVSLTENTNWKQVERTNISGDYEVIVKTGVFSSFGPYTIKIDSNDPGAGSLVAHLPIEGVFGAVTDTTPTATS